MADNLIPMTAPPETYRKRRAALASSLSRAVLILAGRARARQHATNLHPFRAGSNYLYFGGPPLEGAAWLIEPGSDGVSGCTLFRRQSDLEDAVWVGTTPSDETIAACAGVSVGALADPASLDDRLGDRMAALIAPPCPPSLVWASSEVLKDPTDDELLAIIALRLTKDEHELTAMRVAAQIGVQAQLAAIKAVKPGRGEADIAAALMAVIVKHQAAPSFTPIVTIHGEILHSETYPHTLEAGKLLLIDAGAEERGGYASDMTRTVPVSGTFTPIQRQLYDTCLRSMRAGIEACVPGARYRDVHDTSALVICEGLVEAGLLRGDPAQLLARRAHTLFFTHGVGHLIGLDVHDMEDFGDLAGYPNNRTRRTGFGDKFLRLDCDMVEGMTVTIEPGIYLVPAVWHQDEMIAPFADVVNRPAVDALIEAGFGGIRLEETICVRGAAANGPEVLTGDLPADAEAIEALVGAS